MYHLEVDHAGVHISRINECEHNGTTDIFLYVNPLICKYIQHIY